MKKSGYMSSDMTRVTDFEGNTISQKVNITSSWKAPQRNNWITDRYYQVQVLIDGIWYTGRTAGGSMSINLKICKSLLP